MSSFYLIFFVFFFFSVFNFLVLNNPPFSRGFAKEDEVDEVGEVGEGVGQVRLQEELESACRCILGRPESMCSIRSSAVPAGAVMPSMPIRIHACVCVPCLFLLVGSVFVSFA